MPTPQDLKDFMAALEGYIDYRAETIVGQRLSNPVVKDDWPAINLEISLKTVLGMDPCWVKEN